MPHIEAGLALVRMAFDDLQDAAAYVCTKRDFESANGDDEDEEEDEEEEKKKEKDEEDEDDDDDDDGAIQRLSRQAGKIRLKRAGYDFAPRTLSRIDPAIRAGVSIAINEDSACVFRTIGLASVNRVRA